MKDGKILENIVGCQIVRRSCKPIYQKTLLQVAIAKPISQDLYITDFTGEQWDQIRRGETPTGIAAKQSPSYPTGFLLSSPVSTVHGYYGDEAYDIGFFPAYARDNKLYQAFSNEFDFRRDDIVSRLKSYSLFVQKVANYTLYQDNTSQDDAQQYIKQARKYTEQARKNISSGVHHSLSGIEFVVSGKNYKNEIPYINIDKYETY